MAENIVRIYCSEAASPNTPVVVGAYHVQA